MRDTPRHPCEGLSVPARTAFEAIALRLPGGHARDALRELDRLTMDIKGTIQATLDLIEERGNALAKLHPCAGLSYGAKHAFERRARDQDYLYNHGPEAAELDAAGLLVPADNANDKRETRDITELALEHFAAWQHAAGINRTVKHETIQQTRRRVGEAMWAEANPDV